MLGAHTYTRTMPTVMGWQRTLGADFSVLGDAERRLTASGETRPVPSQSRHCSCTCAQLSTGRPPLLLHVPVDPKGGFAMNDVKRSQRRPVSQGGFTLIELLIVLAVFGVVAAMAIPLYANAEAHDRIEKAQSDLEMLAMAVMTYKAHMGTLPAAMTALTATATNRLNWSAGPFMPLIPSPPRGGTPAWSGTYTYTSSTAGTFSITASGDGTTITVP